MHPDVHRSTVYNSQDREAMEMTISGGMDKEGVVCVCIYIYNEILLSHKRVQNRAICRHVDGPRECHTE